jgi:hypothetical protein
VQQSPRHDRKQELRGRRRAADAHVAPRPGADRLQRTLCVLDVESHALRPPPQHLAGLGDPDALPRFPDGALPQMASSRRMLRRRGLLDAIRSGHVASVGLDSFALEPIPAPHPFQGEPRSTLGPHLGGVAADTSVNLGVGAARNAPAALRG